MKNILKLAAVLTLICSVCTAILAAVNAVTKEPIAQSKARRIREAAQKVLPGGSEPITVTRVINGTTNTCFVAKDAAGAVTAVAVQGTAKKGYGGPITLMVGIAADGTLINYEVTQQTETPGLGSKITDPDGIFAQSLLTNKGKPRQLNTTTWTVKQDGGTIDAVTAATISSRAALEAVRNAIATYEAIKESL